jgi:TupA-like ATPgrasp
MEPKQHSDMIARSQSTFTAPWQDFSLPALRLSLKRARIGILYLWRHGRLPNLNEPTLFTEMVQCRKLAGRNAFISSLIDKVRVKEFVDAKLGFEWLIPTIWSGAELPFKPEWDYPFIVKSTHGCNQYAVVRNQDDWSAIRPRALSWLSKPYGGWLDEQYYADVTPGIIVEPFVGKQEMLPIDYKIYVFGGKAAFIQVHIDRATNHHWCLFDPEWNCLSRQSHEGIEPPVSLLAMIEAAEKLANSIDFVRVDFYEIDANPLFGEMTFYPGSGLDPFDPPVIDAVMGSLWLDAIARLETST